MTSDNRQAPYKIVPRFNQSADGASRKASREVGIFEDGTVREK